MIGNATQINLTNLTSIGNSTNIVDLTVRVNHIVFNGWFWFTILWLIWIISFVAMQKVKDQPMSNALYAFGFVTILSLMSRALSASVNGITRTLLTDHQMWVFPLLTIILAVIIYAQKRS